MLDISRLIEILPVEYKERIALSFEPAAELAEALEDYIWELNNQLDNYQELIDAVQERECGDCDLLSDKIYTVASVDTRALEDLIKKWNQGVCLSKLQYFVSTEHIKELKALLEAIEEI